MLRHNYITPAQTHLLTPPSPAPALTLRHIASNCTILFLSVAHTHFKHLDNKAFKRLTMVDVNVCGVLCSV